MALALEGIKVVEAAQVAAAPMAARHLADFGADVIHIEPPVTGDAWRAVRPGWRAFRPGATVPGVAPDTASGTEYINYSWENYNRNKRSLALDITQETGREIIYKLLSRADVFVTNLRMFEREKFGLEYETLHKLYPGLIYGSLSGYGKEGPEKITRLMTLSPTGPKQVRGICIQCLWYLPLVTVGLLVTIWRRLV